MARTRKSIQALNLYKYDVLIDDRGPRSDYFKITQFDGYFYGGRNAFLVAGATVLKPRSKLLVEILNVNNETIFSAPATNFIEGGSRLVQVEVYADTPPGPGKLVILGSTTTYLDGTPVPREWQNKYNVRWVVDVIISPKINNKTPIRFLNTPNMVVEEKFYPTAATSSFSQSVFVPSGDYELTPISYNIFQNGYFVELRNPTPDNIFKSEYLNGTLNTQIIFKDSTEIISASLPITNIFNSTTAEVRGRLLTSSLGTKVIDGFISGAGIDYTSSIRPYGALPISASNVQVQYNKVVQSENTASLASFAKIRLTNLNTLSGEIQKVRISYKPTTEPGEYIVLGDIATQVEELLSADSGSSIVNFGQFNVINIPDYWYAATMSWKRSEVEPIVPSYYLSSSVSTNLTITQSSARLLDAISATPEISSSGTTYIDDVAYFVGTVNSSSFELFPNSEYTLQFDATVSNISGSIQLSQSDYSLEVYLVRSENNVSTTRILERSDKGQLLGTLTYTRSSGKQLFNATQFNFKPKILRNGTFGLRFVVYGGFWDIANVSLKVAEEEFFNPDEITVLVPNNSFTKKLLTFRADYLDINNNSVRLNTFSDPVFFDGTLLNITANFSGSFTGSLFGTASFAQTASFVEGIKSDKLETVFYVTQEGSDTNDGRTLGTAFRTIKYACQVANTYLNTITGSVLPRVNIEVKTGYYHEEAPITVPRNTSIIGDDLRTVVVKPTTATKNNNLFLMNNSTYAWGLRLEGCEIDDLKDPRNGFFFAFAPSASITTSPYVQNCTAAHTPPDKFYVPLKFDAVNQPNPQVGNGPGGMIVDDSVLDGYSPLKSMIVDAYTQVAFNGIGICVRGAGYAQLVSFFTNFSHIGVWCINGGHASLLNSNTTFGDYGLRSTGKRMLVIPDIETVSTASDSAAATLIAQNTGSIINYMMTQLQLNGNYSASYADTNSPIYASTIKDSGILLNAIVSDLLGETPGRTVQFTQGLFKGQDTSIDKKFTLPTASGFTTGAIAVFRVNDGLLLAEDFINSWKYIKDYIITDPDILFTSLTPDAQTKITDLINIPIETISSSVIFNEPTLLQEFGSLVTSTSHDFSYAGAGVNFLALPSNQGGIGTSDLDIRVFEEDGGRVFHTSGDETGDFYTGQDFVIRQETGIIEGRTFQRALAAQFTPLALSLESI